MKDAILIVLLVFETSIFCIGGASNVLCVIKNSEETGFSVEDWFMIMALSLANLAAACMWSNRVLIALTIITLCLWIIGWIAETSMKATKKNASKDLYESKQHTKRV